MEWNGKCIELKLSQRGQTNRIVAGPTDTNENNGKHTIFLRLISRLYFSPVSVAHRHIRSSCPTIYTEIKQTEIHGIYYVCDASLSLSLPQNNVMPIAESIYYYLSILDYSDDDNSFYIPILIQPESICNIIVIYFCAVIKKYTPTNLCGCWCVDKIGPVDTVCELSIAYHTISIADVSDFYPYSVSGELNFWKQRVSDYTLFRVWKKKRNNNSNERASTVIDGRSVNDIYIFVYMWECSYVENYRNYQLIK